ncbi:hypothetical protein [Burkholderia phage FLC9]|nr:hypothetical protein [Burkholderia phage FLC9]
MISFHAYWIPIWITVICVGIPLSVLLSPERVPFQSIAAAGFLVMGSLISVVAWLIFYISTH